MVAVVRHTRCQFRCQSLSLRGICDDQPEHRSLTLVQGGHPPRPLNCRPRLHEEVHPHAWRPRRQSFFDHRLADYSGDEERRKSVTGVLIFAFGSLVYWRSKRISAIRPSPPMVQGVRVLTSLSPTVHLRSPGSGPHSVSSASLHPLEVNYEICGA